MREKSRERILRHEIAVARTAWRALHALDQVELFTPEPDGESFAPVLSFRVRGVPSEETAAALAQAGIAVRAGLHCAPAAHRFMGTLESGAVRVCPSAFHHGTGGAALSLAVMRSVVRNSQDVHKEKRVESCFRRYGRISGGETSAPVSAPGPCVLPAEKGARPAADPHQVR